MTHDAFNLQTAGPGLATIQHPGGVNGGVNYDGLSFTITSLEDISSAELSQILSLSTPTE